MYFCFMFSHSEQACFYCIYALLLFAHSDYEGSYCIFCYILISTLFVFYKGLFYECFYFTVLWCPSSFCLCCLLSTTKRENNEHQKTLKCIISGFAWLRISKITRICFFDQQNTFFIKKP